MAPRQGLGGLYRGRMSAPVTTESALDRAAAESAENAETWARLPIPSKMAMLADLRTRTGNAAERWVRAACEAKGIPPGSPLEGEEWLSGPYAMLIAVDALHQSLERLWRGQPTYKESWVRRRSNGRTLVNVLPADWHDHLLLSGYKADVWMRPGVTPRDLRRHTATFYAQTLPKGRVCLVLGAGNIASIPPLDVLHKLYVEGQVVILKMNPVNDYLGEIFEEVFAEYIDRGFLRLVYGGGQVGSYLVHHDAIDSVHLTGSDKTHDLIVFGGGEEGHRRKERGEPLVRKPINSELGGISPVIVVPGPWSEEDLQHQAEHFVTQKLHNGGFNCIAAQVLVMPDTWPHTDRFLDIVEYEVANAPERPAYYPGAHERQIRAAERHHDSITVSTDPHRTHLRNVDPDSKSFAFTEEFFSATFATTRLANGDAGSYLDAAVAFVNSELHGSLGASILIHPETREELGARFDNAVARMRYGCIGINVWSGMGFLLPRASWGAFPGSTLHDIGSGRGVVHNALMFERAERTVIHGPFRPFHRAWQAGEFHLAPKPPWFVTHETAGRTARALTAFAADASLKHLPSIFNAALRG
jgi:aldehyde dehydrogenase (NAD(P)+)